MADFKELISFIQKWESGFINDPLLPYMLQNRWMNRLNDMKYRKG